MRYFRIKVWEISQPFRIDEILSKEEDYEMAKQTARIMAEDMVGEVETKITELTEDEYLAQGVVNYTIVLDEYGNFCGEFESREDAENYVDSIDPQGVRNYVLR